jgi:catechol 2,3-dioxygenase-like lactoylglutathione lyase family enzyme
MDRPRIRHIAINVEDREKAAEYYKNVFKLEEKERGPNGTIYLSDGFVDVALIKAPDLPWGIHHFGFVVTSVKAIEECVGTTANANAVAESWIKDPEGNRVDISEHGWPV